MAEVLATARCAPRHLAAQASTASLEMSSPSTAQPGRASIVGDKLVYEKRGTTDIYYFYDPLGTPTAIKWYNGNTEQTMYLATNMAGDVIGLYSDTGVLMVRFEYDAWGNIVAETDASGSGLVWKSISGLR